MVQIFSRVARAIVMSAFFSVAAAPAMAQLLVDREEMRSRQAQLFTQMSGDPANLDLAFEYAKLSIQLEDYEAAISTLERMLIYRQDLSRVRLELAVAYFNLGSYAPAELYFNQVLDDPETPDTVRARINRYLEAIGTRTQTSAFTVRATVGITHSTNATLGPDSNQILALGNTATLLSGGQEADTGLRVNVNVSHFYDLQQEDDDFWKTDVNFYSVRYFDAEEGNILFGSLRTGPRLSLDEQRFGPKARPYVEAQYLNSQDRGLFGSYGVGVEVSDTLSPDFSAFGDAGFRYRNYFRQQFDDEDLYNFYTLAGIAYVPTRDVVLRGMGLIEIDSADADHNTNIELGLRVSGEYQYDPGIDWIDRKWAISGYGEVRGRWFDAPDPAISTVIDRRDIDFRAGLRHVFAIQQGFGVQLDVDGLVRESNVVNFDLDSVNATLSVLFRM